MTRLKAPPLCWVLGMSVFLLSWSAIWSTYIPFASALTADEKLQGRPSPNAPHSPERRDVDIVAASQKRDDMSWLPAAVPTWRHRVYVVDDPGAEFRVPMNKGHEAMVYLTYIIDHYDSLPSVVVFHHAERYQWHNDDPLYDGERMLRRLNVSYVEEVGYTSLRCCWTIGCPVEIRPHIDEMERPANPSYHERKYPWTGWYYKEAFQSLFPGQPVPDEIGAPCCAQFAVTSGKILEQPRHDYERYRQWLFDTDLRDYVSGRIFEYAWHIMFGQASVSCPSASACYCKLYGLCDLECDKVDGECGSQYRLPASSIMPARWPEFDLYGRWQNASEM